MDKESHLYKCGARETLYLVPLNSMNCSCPDFLVTNKACKHILACCLRYCNEHNVGVKENSPHLIVNAVVAHMNGLLAMGGSIFPQVNYNVARHTTYRPGAPAARVQQRIRARNAKIRRVGTERKRSASAAAAEAEGTEMANVDDDADDEDSDFEHE